MSDDDDEPTFRTPHESGQPMTSRRWHSMGSANWWRPHKNGFDAWYAEATNAGWVLERVVGDVDGPPLTGNRSAHGWWRTLAEAKAAALDSEASTGWQGSGPPTPNPRGSGSSC